MRTAIAVVLFACACGSSAGDSPDAGGGSDDGAPPATDSGTLDAAAASCPDIFREFTLDLLETHSNVCVDRAICTFEGGEGCAGSVTCEYQGAGTLTDSVQFEQDGDAWVAS